MIYFTYDELVSFAESNGIKVIDTKAAFPLSGAYADNAIFMNPSLLKTSKEKRCVFVEELGHHYCTVGNILDQRKPENRKQEKIARAWAYERFVPLGGILVAYWSGVKSRYELADYLNITESFLQEALDYYKGKYGPYHAMGNNLICFEPLAIIKANKRKKYAKGR